MRSLRPAFLAPDRFHSPAWNQLRQLMQLRTLAIVGQVATLILAEWKFSAQLPLLELLGAIGVLALANFGTWLRLRFVTSDVTANELLMHLIIDIAEFTAVMYLAGGPANPFVFMYLLPLAIAASALPVKQASIAAVVTIAAFSLVTNYHEPLHLGLAELQRTRILSLGLWLNFVVTASLVSYFVVKISGTLREHEALLAQAREREMDKEYVLGVGILAANATQHLSGPLHKMGMIARQIAADHPAAPGLAERTGELAREIDRCRAALAGLLASAEEATRRGPPAPAQAEAA